MQNEFAHHVFLSHSAKDKAVVRAFHSLSALNGERAGERCRNFHLTERLEVAVRQHLKVWFDEWLLQLRDHFLMQAYKIMHGLWGMGQMMFTKYNLVVDDDVDVHNTSEVLFRLCANTDPQRDSIFTKGPADVLDHATSEIAIGSKLGIDATKKLPGEGFKRPWPPLIKMDAAVKAKVNELFREKL